MRNLFIVILFLVAATASLAGPIFPTRGFLMRPRWYGKTDTTSIFDHGGYYSHVERGFGSDSDRWGWSVTMGAIFEFARWGGDKSLFGFAGMELIADTHNDISFKPHGAMWEEGLMYAVHENPTFDWQIGTVYRCRHDLDNIDPRQYSDIGGQRTLIYCSLSGKAIGSFESTFGLDLPTTAWLRADFYLIREDYRLPESYNGIGTDFQKLAWTFGPAFQSKLARWSSSAMYLSVSANLSAFGNETGFLSRYKSVSHLTLDAHAELGYEFTGRATRFQLYAGFQHWEDDGQTPIPRSAQYAILGVRVLGSDMAAF